MGRTVVEFQDATDRLDAAAATYLGVNRTDLLCIDLLLSAGGLTAGELATQSGLSPAATTAAVERLEARDYATRTRDESDRRRVLVRLTPLAETRSARIYGNIQRTGTALLARYSRSQLETIEAFLTEGIAFRHRETTRIQAL